MSDELPGLFTRASKLVRELTDEAMSRHGVRVGQNIMLQLLSETDGLTPGDIANRIGNTVPTIVNTATRMETAGLLVRRRDPDDARLVRLYLTDKAREVYPVIQAERRDIERRISASLTEEEQLHLRSALKKIIAELS
ncbi:MAG TPA: MarR family transcriptional regulator [Pseudonocardiaceae bacterium]|nr:MarR family transcriptional regulator [Pseudonocardiaceae bacterium]